LLLIEIVELKGLPRFQNFQIIVINAKFRGYEVPVTDCEDLVVQLNLLDEAFRRFFKVGAIYFGAELLLLFE